MCFFFSCITRSLLELWETAEPLMHVGFQVTTIKSRSHAGLSQKHLHHGVKSVVL